MPAWSVSGEGSSWLTDGSLPAVFSQGGGGQEG